MISYLYLAMILAIECPWLVFFAVARAREMPMAIACLRGYFSVSISSAMCAMSAKEKDIVGDAERYFSARCGAQACEMAYKIFRVPTPPTFSF